MAPAVKEVRLAAMAKLAPAIEALIQKGYMVRLTVTGNSMYPFLRPGLDSVTLCSPGQGKLKAGDIALYRRGGKQYVLHRVVKVGAMGLYFAGDAQGQVEGPLPQGQVLAVVCQVWRGQRIISCDSSLWRGLSLIWRWLLPLRPMIIRSYSRVRRLVPFRRGKPKS